MKTNFQDAVDINRKLDAEQRFVVNVAKSSYDGINNKDYDAIKAIEAVVYGNTSGKTPNWCIINYLRDILLTAHGWSLEQWEYKNRQWFKDAEEAVNFWREDFFQAYTNKVLSEVQHFTVNYQTEGVCGKWFRILDLDIDTELENKFLAKLDKAE